MKEKLNKIYWLLKSCHLDKILIKIDINIYIDHTYIQV